MSEEFVDEDGVIWRFHRDSKGKRLTDTGAEVPDPRPMAPPVNFRRQLPLHERLRAMVQHEFQRAKERDEVESPEEADDFATGEDVDEFDAREGRFRDLRSFEYEETFEPPENDSALIDRLVKAGWTPPPAKRGQEASPVEPTKPAEASEKPLDAAKPADDGKDAPRASGSKKP